jgi:hypothetical protein
VAGLLASEARVAPGDATIVLVENTREDWSFGPGVAHYLELPMEQWKMIGEPSLSTFRPSSSPHRPDLDLLLTCRRASRTLSRLY